MKHRKLTVLLSSCFLAAGVATAQEKKMEAPKPGPEHKKLEYFVGDWQSEGEMKAGPWGAGGKMTGSEHCSWMPGGFFVLCHEEGTSPMGNVKGIAVSGYDPVAKAYTWNGFNSMGENENAAGSFDGKTWTYTNESMMGGKMIKGRYTIAASSPTSYDFKLETSEDGKTWGVMMEGKVTKKAAK
jgi:hypothetical protein